MELCNDYFYKVFSSCILNLFIFFFLSLPVNKFNADKKNEKPIASPPGKCHLHSDADRGTDKTACRGEALADGKIRWDGANEPLEILQRNSQNNPRVTQ